MHMFLHSRANARRVAARAEVGRQGLGPKRLSPETQNARIFLSHVSQSMS